MASTCLRRIKLSKPRHLSFLKKIHQNKRAMRKKTLQRFYTPIRYMHLVFIVIDCKSGITTQFVPTHLLQVGDWPPTLTFSQVCLINQLNYFKASRYFPFLLYISWHMQQRKWKTALLDNIWDTLNGNKRAEFNPKTDTLRIKSKKEVLSLMVSTTEFRQ